MHRTGLGVRCLLLLVAAALLALGAGCSGYAPWDDLHFPGDWGGLPGGVIDIQVPAMGTLQMVVLWPEAQSAATAVRGLPAETDLVRVTVTGSGIDQPLVGECTENEVTNGQARITVGSMRSGPNRQVLTEARDTDTAPDQVLASRTVTVTVPAWATVEVHMDMALEPVLAVSPTPIWFWKMSQMPWEWQPRDAWVANAGGGALNWIISVDQPWISVSPLSGTDDGLLQVSVDPDELPSWESGDPPRDDVGWVTVDAGDLEARIQVQVHRQTAAP